MITIHSITIDYNLTKKNTKDDYMKMVLAKRLLVTPN